MSDAEGGTHTQLDPKFIWKEARKQAVLQTGVLTTTIYFCTLIGALPLIHEVFSPQTKHVRASLHLWSLNCKYLEFSSMAHYLYGKLKLYTMRILLFVLVKLCSWKFSHRAPLPVYEYILKFLKLTKNFLLCMLTLTQVLRNNSIISGPVTKIV